MRQPDFYDYDKVLKERDEAVAALQEAQPVIEAARGLLALYRESSYPKVAEILHEALERYDAAVPVPAPKEPDA